MSLKYEPASEPLHIRVLWFTSGSQPVMLPVAWFGFRGLIRAESFRVQDAGDTNLGLAFGTFSPSLNLFAPPLLGDPSASKWRLSALGERSLPPDRAPPPRSALGERWEGLSPPAGDRAPAPGLVVLRTPGEACDPFAPPAPANPRPVFRSDNDIRRQHAAPTPQVK